MPIRDRIIWGPSNPFSDSRLARLDVLVREIRLFHRLPQGVTGGAIFRNDSQDLPQRPHDYYREYDVAPPTPDGRGTLRLVLGNGGEVFITGNHYNDFRQVIGVPQGTTVRPATMEELIETIQREFPEAAIRITGRGRTIRRQAELMASSRRADRATFLQTYRPAPHITAMDAWVAAHPLASELETVNEFERIIRAARQGGAVVSNHLSDNARDISIPAGGSQVRRQVEARINELGGHVIREESAAGGPHWHVDWE